MVHKAWCCLGEAPYWFSRSFVKFQGHTAKKNRRFWPNFGVSVLLLQFEFTSGYKRMHKAWSSMEEVSYYFSRSSIKFQGHTGQKIANFDPNWAFPDCNFSFTSPAAMTWCIKLEATWKRCPVVFQGHPLNFKVTRDKKSPIWPELSVSGL